MRPQEGHCTRCNKNFSIFSDIENCPLCKSPLKFDNHNICEECSARIEPDARLCASCHDAKESKEE